MSDAKAVSQRLLRKGCLLDETYTLFRGWHDDESFDDNFSRVFVGYFKTDSWAREVKTTLQRRFRDLSHPNALITLTRSNMSVSDWRYVLLLWIASNEPLYREFAEGWLYPEYESGCYLIRTKDIVDYVQKMWGKLNPDGVTLSEYGLTRTARDLLRMARDLGVLTGDGSTKNFATMHFSDELKIYFCHAIAELEGSTSRVPISQLWRVLLQSPESVHEELLRLHQYRKLDYQVAGSLIQLTLPCASANEYAERMAV